jgi:hypothetical protein
VKSKTASLAVLGRRLLTTGRGVIRDGRGSYEEEMDFTILYPTSYYRTTAPQTDANPDMTEEKKKSPTAWVKL